jgi:hypothetical protein
MAEMVTGKTIRMPCMRRGLVSYPDETILVSQDALEQLATTAFGIPVVVEHPGIALDSESIKNIKIAGRVAKFEYDLATDLWFAEFVVDDEDAVNLLKSGWGVSTAWYGDDYTNGGTYNNIAYDRQLLKGRYEHLAIVQNPRYEMAVDPIFLNSKSKVTGQATKNTDTIIVNSKGTTVGGIKMFAKIFRTVREEIKANDNEELVLELEHGQVPLSKVVEELKSYKAKEAEATEGPAHRVLNEDDEVEVDGKKMKVGALIKEHAALKAKHEASKDKMHEAEDRKDHEDEAEDEDRKDHEDEDKKHEAEDRKDHEDEAMCAEDEGESEGKKVKKAENSRFKSLKKAYENGSGIKIENNFMSTKERLDLGRSRYGTTKK